MVIQLRSLNIIINSRGMNLKGILIVLLCIVSFGVNSAQTIESAYSQSFSYKEILFDDTTGGGGFVVKEEGNKILISGGGSFNPARLKQGVIGFLESPYQIPDVELGYIKYLDGEEEKNSNYLLEIKNNWLLIKSDNHEYLKSVVLDFEVDLTGYPRVSNNFLAHSLNPTKTENYVRTITAQEPLEGPLTIYHNGTNSSIAYYDDLGGLKQVVDVKATPNKKDIITHFEYNERGNKVRDYLPFPSDMSNGAFDNTAKTNTFNHYNQDKYLNTLNPFSEKIVAKAPNAYLIESAAPGNPWKYDANNISITEGTRTIVIPPKEDINLTDVPDFTQEFSIKNFLNSNASSLATGKITLEVYDGYKVVLRISQTSNFVASDFLIDSSVPIEGWHVNDMTFGLKYANTNDLYVGRNLSIENDNLILKFGGFTDSDPEKSFNYTYTNITATNEEIYGKTVVETFVDKIESSNHTVKVSNHTNSHEEVRRFQIGHYSSNIETPYLINKGFYESGELHKVITKDENWQPRQEYETDHTFEEFKTKDGKLVLKRTYDSGVQHDTYYVYDFLGNLTYVIPPLLDIEEVTFDDLNSLGYQYRYDIYNRVYAKKLPGKQWEIIIYDKLDRPIMTQDGQQRLKNEWSFIKYESFGRVAYTGLYTNNNDVEPNFWLRRKNLQNRVDNHSVVSETKMNSSVEQIDSIHLYYTNDAFPSEKEDQKILTISYYDSYNFDLQGIQIPIQIYDQTVNSHVKGLPTGNHVRVGNRTDWITTVNCYNKKKQVIYTESRNDFLKTLDKKKIAYDFVGNVVKTRSTHQRERVHTIVTQDTFTYDHMGRLLKHVQCVGDELLSDECGKVEKIKKVTYSQEYKNSKTFSSNVEIVFAPGFHVKATHDTEFAAIIEVLTIDEDTELILENMYDELGQLITKKVGNTQASPLQEVNYKYNVRGWLTFINDPNTSNTKDLFNFELKYDKPSTGVTPLYNGNISQAFWRTASEDNSRKYYNYSYDALNRLKEANFYSNGNTAFNGFMDETLQYDKNGNITQLHRTGVLNNGSFDANLDILDYTYQGNQLLKVVDTGHSYEGFDDHLTTGNSANDYTYDANGNMIKDNNKGITSISYNHLNLPTTIVFNTGSLISYTYDASGVKLKKQVVANGTTTTTEYAGAFTYKYTGTNTPKLEFIAQPEGYITKENNKYQYVYQHKDHLGNIRVSYSDNDGDGHIDILRGTSDIDGDNDYSHELIEEHNYYAFGMKHKGYNTLVSGKHYPYQFGGKEEQKELGLEWLDFGARNYDASLGRWMTFDPKADDILQVDLTPYNYSWNNPVNVDDPDGECPWCVGAIVGLITEVASQVAVSMIEGNSFKEAVKSINVKQVIVSGVAGGLSGGLSIIKNAKGALKLYKAMTNVAIEGLASMADQAVEDDFTGKIDVKKVGLDVIAAPVSLTKVKSNKLQKASGNLKTAERKLDRAERTMRTDKPTRQQKVKEAKAEVESKQSKVKKAELTKDFVEQGTDSALLEAGKEYLKKREFFQKL